MKAGNSFFLTLIALTLATLGAPIKSANASKRIDLKVGIALRLDDKFNNSVSEMMTGIETAKVLFQERNKGTRIELRRYPHAEELSTVMAAADFAIKDQMPAVIGGELSEEAFILRDKLGPKKIVFMTPTSSNPAVTEGYPFSFRSCFSDRLVAEDLAEFTLDRLKANSIGVIHNVSSPYTDFLSSQFVESANKNAKKSGKRIQIFDEKVLRDTLDFSAQIKNFMDHQVTHVAMLAHQTDLLRFATQASAKGFFPIYIGSDGWGSNESIYKKLVKEAGGSGPKFVGYRNSYWKEESSTPLGKEFKAKYLSLYHHEPNAWSAISFDAAWVLFTGMQNAGDHAGGDRVRQELLKLKNLPVVTSEAFTFGTDNSPRKELYIYRVDKNGAKFEEALK